LKKRDTLDGVRGPGSGFGELALGEGDPHAFTAIANQHTHVLNLSNEILFDAMLDYPEVGVAMVRVLARRLSEVAQRVHDLEGQLAHLNATLQRSGVEAPAYVSGAYRRPEARPATEPRSGSQVRSDGDVKSFVSGTKGAQRSNGL
jgi:CRP-like cAMP-binding protein